MFGGAVDSYPKAYDSMFVLSLPSFTWTSISTVQDKFRRYGHSCAIVGNSQLLTWGGVPKGTQQEMYASEDPWPQGIGIFDLNDHAWRDDYKADAPAYKVHRHVVAG